MNSDHRPPRAGTKRLTAALQWLTRRRRTALAHLLRGACYGMGTGMIGLAFIWVERLM
ncbi:hypothetical protein AB0K80_31370 [Streptomyces sp. NPDC052682]|uniref:hypothetical protein n=1 Tax=Streptomyces sp. NPDC052682 TaxID=3154954 RepID=UPI003434F7A7